MKNGCVFFLCLFLLGCDVQNYTGGPIGKTLRYEIRDKKQTEIDLAKVLPFQWDELFLFPPYTPREEICKKFELKKTDCLLAVQAVSKDDGEMSLVLRYQRKIVHTEIYPRFNGDFLPLDFTQPITPQTARFVVVEDGVTADERPWLRLRPTGAALATSATP